MPKTVSVAFDCVELLTERSDIGPQLLTGGLEVGYKHEVIRPTIELGDNLLPLVNRVASLLKRWLLGTHQGAVEATHLDYYLDEYVFRFNRRTAKSRGLLFMRLVEQAIQVPPVRNSTLHGKPA